MRPRYGRLAVLGASVSVTGIAMLGGVGVLPSVADGSRQPTDVGHLLAGAHTTPSAQLSAATTPTSASRQQVGSRSRAGPTGPTEPSEPAEPTESQDPAVPDRSGEGKRIVFDQSDQRVWLVGEDDHVERTYLVSGSLYDNLDPGTYSVYSKSEQAWGVDDSGSMKYFVRFAQGTHGAAIGFHDIPIDNGHLVQTAAQLGSPQSHGCIRQLRSDAIALWDFAPVGTEVDVTA